MFRSSNRLFLTLFLADLPLVLFGVLTGVSLCLTFPFGVEYLLSLLLCDLEILLPLLEILDDFRLFCTTDSSLHASLIGGSAFLLVPIHPPIAKISS
ncbi:unnamed protein product [Moneuplotes crassus]|uniref:Uncharacterized protein n=1 Tax=Euplotes crassus TaxID=5936 RepID=A0AAD1X6S5_EUPCR|nr:unnamed protein product [Moneuplotes crassus]